MAIEDERIRDAISRTEVLRSPRQLLATFGTSVINYYLLTEPIYRELVGQEETVVREGQVSAERPRIVTPRYLTTLEGFGENARRYLEMAIREYGPHAPGLLYAYKNEHKGLTIASQKLEVVVEKLKEEMDKKGEYQTAIIKGVDELWDVSLLSFIRGLTEGSLRQNLRELQQSGLLDIDQAGVPRDAKYRIEELFDKVKKGLADPVELKRELDRWELFSEYEERFLNLFRKER